MMYGNKMAIAIKSAGKVLREFNKDTVYLPFGAEYSIFIKNLDTVRASVSISIDGQDVADGDTFIVNGSSAIDIERFLKKGNLNEGNRFKFIERSPSVEQHRGIGVEDGIVVVKYKFEKRLPKTEIIHHHHHHDNYPWPYNPPLVWSTYDTRPINSTGVRTKAASGILRGNFASGKSSSVAQSANINHVANDVGITVPGSVSQQQFQTVAEFQKEEQEFSLVLRLVGQTGSQQVSEPITVKHKQKCITCGFTNKSTAKFCGNCGTSLEIV